MKEIETILDVFISPKKAFLTLKEKNYFFLVLLFTLLVSFFSAYVSTRHINYKEFKFKLMERMEKAGKVMTEEEAESMIEKQENFSKKFGHFFALVGSLISILFISFLFYLFFKLSAADFSFKSSLSFTLHGLLPSVLSGIIGTLLLLKKGFISYKEMGNVLASHLGVFVDGEKSPVLYAFLSSLDFFSIWSLGLLVYGFSILSGEKIKTSATIILSLWILYVLIKILFAGLKK